MDATEAKALLTGYLNKRMRVVISDGRVIDGNFLCTDKDSNIVLGNCEEFFSQEEVAEIESNPRGHMRQPRTLGLAIVPGDHVVSIAIAKGFVTESPQAPPDPESPRTATDPSPLDPESLQTCTNLNSPQVTPSDPTLEMKSRQIHTNLESQSHVGDLTHPESPQLHISDLTHPESPQSHVGDLRQLEPESLQVSTDLTQPGAEPPKIQCETKQVTSSELESNADL